jgi:predicted RNase H-like HicB family nuclease
MRLKIDVEQETDGRWIAEVPDLPGVLAYGADREAAMRAAKALAFRVIADRLENGEPIPADAELFTHFTTATRSGRKCWRGLLGILG